MSPAWMIVRRMRFPYPDSLKAWWNPARPEFSQVVNAASLAMPFLEPYLIDTMRQAKEKITDPRLLADVDAYVGQESTHFRQHQQFNKRLADLGYKSVPAMEQTLREDYSAFARTRSFTFNVAYAEGFEAMALTIGHMLLEEREFLFGNAEPSVSSLILWHFVEEIEHKTVTYDVFKALDGRYAWRIYGLLYATIHIMARTRQGYRAMLIEDGRWFTLSSRLALYGVLLRVFRRLLPRMLRILGPGYDPRQVPDPDWMKSWRSQHEAGNERLGALDTTRLTSPVPDPCPPEGPTMSTMPERLRALLFLNGIGLFCFAVFVGWQWFFALLGEIVLWPIIPDIDFQFPADHRAWRMVHMEAITQGLMLMALGLGGRFIQLSTLHHKVFFWSAVVTAWFFTVPTWFHALLGTRGLAFGGGPFKPGLANDVLYLIGWPPVLGVHIMLFLGVLGAWRYVKTLPPA